MRCFTMQPETAQKSKMTWQQELHSLEEPCCAGGWLGVARLVGLRGAARGKCRPPEGLRAPVVHVVAGKRELRVGKAGERAVLTLPTHVHSFTWITNRIIHILLVNQDGDRGHISQACFANGSEPLPCFSCHPDSFVSSFPSPCMRNLPAKVCALHLFI